MWGLNVVIIFALVTLAVLWAWALLLDDNNDGEGW